VVAHDVAEARGVVEAEDHHERARKLGMLGARAVARRLGEIEVQRKQRRQQVVAEAPRALANLARQEAFVDQIEKGLMRVQRGGDEVLRADEFAVARFDADRAAALDHDARGLRVEPDLAAGFAHRGLERARERRRAATRHLRLGRARQQRGDVMAEAS
jgi:hypothetical protein